MPPLYKVAAPDEYLAITGAGVDLVKICKSAFVWPFQRYIRFSVQPHDYAINLQAMTKEKLQFLLPVVFTVGPDVNARGANSSAPAQRPAGDHVDQEDRGDALMKYAMLLTDNSGRKPDGSNPGSNTTQFLANIVKGIIEGETRVIVSSMTMEEIFTGREEFKRRIFRNIQSELDQFGLKIYNANVKELRDAPESNYFESLARKAHEGATNQARIDVAEAQLRGNVGEAKRIGEQEREIAKINAETAVQKTERDSERAAAEASLASRKTVYNRNVNIAEIEALRAAESKDEELKRDVEVKRAAAEMERLRANDVVKATIAREAKQQAADAKAYEVSVDSKATADARAYKLQAEAKASLEATNQSANAAAYKTRTDADARAYQLHIDAKASLEAGNQSSNAEAYKTRTNADARAYQLQIEAKAGLEAGNQSANLEAYKTRTGADAYAYKQQTEAKASLEAANQTSNAQAYKTRTNADARAYQLQVDAKAGLEAANLSANADAYKTRTGADAANYKSRTGADAANYKSLKDADAANYRSIKEADALLYIQLKEAEGMSALAGAYGKMAQAFGGPSGLLQYMMIKEGTYIELAKANASAIAGMQPKISVWNTGAQGGEAGSSSSTDTMRNVYQMLPPLMTTINEQTGITLPEWQFGRMNGQMAEVEKNKQISKLNGDK